MLTQVQDAHIKNLVEMFEETVKNYPSRGIYHVDGSEEDIFQSYENLLERSKGLTQVLYRHGIAAQTPLILAIDASKNFLEHFWATLVGGILSAPLAPIRTPDVHSMEVQKILHVWEALQCPIIVEASNVTAYATIKKVFEGKNATILTCEDLLAEAEVLGFASGESYEASIDDSAVLQFSSGSTGMPKGARLTHRNLLSNIKAIQNAEHGEQGDTLVSWLPYFHDFGLFACHLMPLMVGMNQVKIASLLFAQRPFLWLEKISQYQGNITSSTNTGIEHLSSFIQLRGKRLPNVDLSSLKVWTLGAEMVSAKACRTLQAQLAPFGLKADMLMPGYGLTETTLAATCHPRSTPIKTCILDRKILVEENRVVKLTQETENSAEFTSVGKAVTECELRITGSDKTPLAPYSVGIVETRGENVIFDYYKNEEATRNSFNGDWFSTGDMGFMDEDGDFYITGRAKEMIIVRGQNYYPADIERIVTTGMEHLFRLVVVCGVYDANLGRDAIILFYIPAKKGDDQGLLQSLHKMNEQLTNLAGFSIDAFFNVRQNDIPRTSSGKVMRKALCEGYLSGQYVDQCVILKKEAVSSEDRSKYNHAEIVQGVWAELLELPAESLDVQKNLFRLGGDSICAMRIQARLEDVYHAKMESNFCYLYPTIEQQTLYFTHRDFSIEPPQNELEAILQKVVASSLEVKADTVGVTADILSMVGDMAKVFALHKSIGEVFQEVNISQEFMSLRNIREMASYLWPLVFPEQTKQEDVEYFPLMHFQETLYFHRKGFVQNEPSGLSCYIYVTARMDGNFQLDIFNKALNYVVARHPIMRSCIDEAGDKPRFKVYRSVPEVESRVIDMSHLTSLEEERDYILSRGLDLNDHRFELSTWPLFFCEITKFSNDRYVFAMNIDHMLVDGYSYMQVFDELFNTHDRMVEGAEWELPEVEMTFGDYVRVEHLRQRTDEYKQALDFQLELFKNLPSKALLPSKCNPATIKEVFFDTYYQEISPEIIEGLNGIASEEQLSLNALLFAAYFKIMNIWCHQDDLIINMPVFNREQYFAGARKTVGSFIDIFPVRLQTSFEEPLIHIARKAEAFTRKLLEVPVSSIELSRELFERENMRATSMSSIIFSNSIGMYAGEVSNMKHVEIEAPEFRTGAPGTFVDLVIYDYRIKRDSDDVYFFNWNYIRDMFDREFIEVIAEQYKKLLKQMIEFKAHPDKVFSSSSIVPPSYEKLLATVNATDAPIPSGTLHGLIAEQMARVPQKEALTFEGKSMDYATFGQKSDDVAALLLELGVQVDDFVSLFLGRSMDMLVGQLGVMKAGAAYLPISIDYPAERVGYVLKDSGTKVVLTQGKYLTQLERDLTGVEHILVLDEVAEESIPASLKDKVHLASAIFVNRKDVVLPDVKPENLAYMIYTSGSTGNPKGAKITHKNIINFLIWVKEVLAISEDERFAFVTSYAFDMTMTSNWVPFLTGASLHILDEEKTKDVNTLINFISERNITFLNVTPSHFSLISAAREFMGEVKLPMNEHMRVMLGGETINVKDLNQWLHKYPLNRFINEYGPTEATVASTFFPIPVNEENLIEMSIVPIGKPVYNTQIYVLNEAQEHCMPGVPGELYIGGLGVSAGYHERPEKNAESFVQNPLNPDDKTDILYRTGDVVRMIESGDVEFMGREDHQINLRGYRIEAGEIESILITHENVYEAVVVAQKDSGGALNLIAFYTGQAIATAILRTHLAQSLPEYMIPVHFEHLEAMPCTPSGKLDKNALPIVSIEASTIVTGGVAPVTELEKKITAIWESVLGINNLSMTSNFWEIGGDSLKAMRLIMRMKKEGFIDFGLREAFEYQTVASIVSRIIQQGDAPQEESGIVTLREGKDVKARLLCLPYACGNPTMYMPLSQQLPEDITVLAANLPGHGKQGEPMTSIAAMAELCVEQLTAFNDGIPMYILGYSFGGFIAYEMARNIEARGHSIGGVFIIASPPPRVTEGLQMIMDSSDEEILRLSKEIYHYDFAHMTEQEREEYLHTLRVDTKAMLDFRFSTTVNAPMLYIVGEEEEEKELLTQQEEWQEVFAHPQYTTVGGAHMLIKSHMEQLAEKIHAFIKN